MTVNGPGTLNLTGNNTLAGALAINSGGVVVATGGNLGASSNLVSVGTPNNGTNVGDPTGALTVSPGVNTTIGSFLSATNNAAANLLTIAAGGSLNVTSSSPLSGLNSSVNGAFVVGTPNALGAMTTSMTISGAGALNVNGGTNNSSFLAGIGNSTRVRTRAPSPWI
jgi:autotransporter-associated beta strand protein